MKALINRFGGAMMNAGVAVLILSALLGFSKFLLMVTNTIALEAPPSWMGWGLLVGIWMFAAGAAMWAISNE